MVLKNTCKSIVSTFTAGVIGGIEIKRIIKGQSSNLEASIVSIGNCGAIMYGGYKAKQSETLSEIIKEKDIGPNQNTIRKQRKPTLSFAIPYFMGLIIGIINYK